jgi:hypothetical protein
MIIYNITTNLMIQRDLPSAVKAKDPAEDIIL